MVPRLEADLVLSEPRLVCLDVFPLLLLDCPPEVVRLLPVVFPFPDVELVLFERPLPEVPRLVEVVRRLESCVELLPEEADFVWLLPVFEERVDVVLLLELPDREEEPVREVEERPDDLLDVDFDVAMS